MMTALQSLQARIDAGRAVRKTVARSSHAALGNIARDPIGLLIESSNGRVPGLVPLRYGRMRASPFAFFRGAAVLQAHDLADTPNTGFFQQICGDAHIMNFGSFATPERNQIFDLVDFDETHIGPWEWDVKRLMVSLSLAARQLGLSATKSENLVFETCAAYQQHMHSYAQMGALALWYEKLSADALEDEIGRPLGRSLLMELAEEGQQHTQERLLPKMGFKVGAHWRMKDAPPELFHIQGATEVFDQQDAWMQSGQWDHLSEKLFAEYLTTLSPSHQHLLRYFSIQDLAFKVVGVGSVGTRCLVLLLVDAQENPLFLQIKEAMPSVLSAFVPKTADNPGHQGRRIVVGQRLMQSASDQFLGWSTAPGARHFYVRQLRDMKSTIKLETLGPARLGRYAYLCARTLARAHARAGGLAAEISGYLGRSDVFSGALVRYAEHYANQVERDFEAFEAACKSGRIVAQSDAALGKILAS